MLIRASSIRSILPHIADQSLVSRYLKRFAFARPQLKTAPAADLELVVVMPVYDEPGLITALDSLFRCQRPDGSTEILLVFNASASDSNLVKDSNRKAEERAREWIHKNHDSTLQFHIINFPDLPPKHAGVGLARKIGMDEAAQRFGKVGQLEKGIIACFDADCTCAPSFLVENVRHFKENPESAGCSTYFEHPLSGDFDPSVYAAAIDYELHLRYYVEALREIQFGYAHHTVGSSMSVRAIDYLKQGGMNRKKAGEDFYFLQKLMTHRPVTELNQTVIYPSARISKRVPFGTGRAIDQALNGQEQTSYPWQAFAELGALVQKIDQLDSLPKDTLEPSPIPLPRTIQQFLIHQEWENAIREIRHNVGDVLSFKKRFWQWFNGFRCMKFLNWSAESKHPRIAVASAASEPRLLRRIGHENDKPIDAHSLLLSYRQHQRRQPAPQSDQTPQSHHE